MRKPPAIRLLSFALAAAGLLSSSARAQDTGSASGADGFAASGFRYQPLDGVLLLSPAYTAGLNGGDGYGKSGSSFTVLDGAALPAQLYTATGNGGDGFSAAGRAYVPLSGSALPSQLYTATGNGGDGYARSGLFSRALDGAVAFLASYKGGSGDGYDTNGLENTFISPEAAVLVIYSGGPSGGDGYDFDGFRYSGLSTDTAPVEMYSATESGADGYDTSGAHHLPLNGATAPVALYAGSASGADGYDRDGTPILSVSGEAAIDYAYLNDGGDGYSLSGFRYGPLSPPPVLPAAALYAGDQGDGYDSQSLPFVQYLGGGEAASPITFSGWLNSRFSEDEIAAGLGAAAADADHDGLGNLLEYAIGSDPRSADASVLGPQFRLSNLSDFGYPALPDYYLTAYVRRNPLALDAVLSVEASSDLASYWSTGETIVVDEVPAALLVRDRFGVETDARRSMRLKASLNP